MPGQGFEEVGRSLQAAVAALAPEWATVTVSLLHGGDPVQVGVDCDPASDHGGVDGVVVGIDADVVVAREQ